MTVPPQPPHSVEAEQSVLGGLLLDENAWDRVADLLQKADFYRHDHQVIFDAVGQLVDQNRPPDIVTVSEILERQGMLEEAGGTAYLATLANNTPYTANITHYAQAVWERAQRRRGIQVAQELAQASAEPGEENFEAIVDRASQALFELSGAAGPEGSTGLADMKTVLKRTHEDLAERHEIRQAGGTVGIPTGISRFDQRFGGLHRGDYILVAGRPSMGKTAYGLTILRHMAEDGYRGAMFSLEMPAEQLAQRLLAQRSKVSVERLRSVELEEGHWRRLVSGMGHMAELPLHIDDSAYLTPTKLYRRARALKQREGLDVVVVDYLQLLRPDHRHDSREREVAEASRALKGLAKDLDVAVVVLAQLSRKVEERQDKRPILADLRESGSLEQDADLILFPWRPGEYFETDPETGDPLQGGEAKILVEKARNGPTGLVNCAYVEDLTLFADLDQGS